VAKDAFLNYFANAPIKALLKASCHENERGSGEAIPTRQPQYSLTVVILIPETLYLQYLSDSTGGPPTFNTMPFTNIGCSIYLYVIISTSDGSL
jgi:hypothetical protein